MPITCSLIATTTIIMGIMALIVSFLVFYKVKGFIKYQENENEPIKKKFGLGFFKKKEKPEKKIKFSLFKKKEITKEELEARKKELLEHPEKGTELKDLTPKKTFGDLELKV